MGPLDKSIRNKLEHVVVEARDIAEAGARAALEQLGVGEGVVFTHLKEKERELRRKLRAHGRQPGDNRNSRGEQDIGRLIEEVAYEHWHRMLFARFLAENNLLMYPDPENPVAVTLEECEDLAADEGAANGWELAARFAARMLPQIFRLNSPVFQLILPPEHQQKLERLVEELPADVFTASDSIGWVYQFWQTKKKDEVNNRMKSGDSVGARELPAVTQLFTEPYMVSFLLDNSLGAWWAVRNLNASDLKNAESENELRSKASLPGVPLKYLRFVRQNNGSWIPAAGTFDDWPEQLNEFKILDPCCGSGHFLVSAFIMLVPMRMKLENLSVREAVDDVLRKNIHGLELDQRCVELAAFALAFTAWCYPGTGGSRPLPELNVACSGLASISKKEEWLDLAATSNNLRIALEGLYEEFAYAPVLGSLLNPESGLSKGSLYELKWEDISPLLTKALVQEKDFKKVEIGVVAKGLVKAAELMAFKYDWIITNPPYLTRGKQNVILKDYCESNYSEGKYDLANVFLERCIKYSNKNGIVQIVMPQNWLSQPRYKNQRKKLLNIVDWKLIARLGEGGFDSSQAAGAFVILFTLQNRFPNRQSILASLDAGLENGPESKSQSLTYLKVKLLIQSKLKDNPDSVIRLDDISTEETIGNYATCVEGLSTGDGQRFIKKFWEIAAPRKDWTPFIQNVIETCLYGGREDYLFWENGKGVLRSFESAHNFPSKYMKGFKVLGNVGLRITQMREARVTLYTGEIFGKSGGTLVLKDNSLLPALWCFASTSEFDEHAQKINPAIYKPVGTYLKIPFDKVRWISKAAAEFPNGLPKPYSENPTQWIFHGHPAKSEQALQVAVARLLGYQWPAEIDPTILLADEQREWATRCNALLHYADKDCIVCIPPVRGEVSAADRLLNLLSAAYGNDWSFDTLAQLLKKADHAGKTLESWLRDKFFIKHCKMFQHRPFIWHIWDGLRDGFAALVNYQKLDAKLLETLIYTYLGDWISHQKQDIANGVDGAQERLAAAEGLKKKLELILEGEAPYDIFVRWKPLEKQPIGWDPDLNDGVRLNIRPFLTVPDVGRKGAGVLRDKPNINWNKDRGKDVGSTPWYHLGSQYGGKEGDRINDHHLSLDEKKKARERK